LVKYFSQGEGFLQYQRHLSFVCGANGDTGSDKLPSLRAAFLSFLNSEGSNRIQPILAEKALEEIYLEHDVPHVNLNEFEKLIAESVDSVLIFPESPGSYAELGLFSGIPELAEKTLVASRPIYQGNSFITMGPIHHLATVSKYRPLPIVVTEELPSAFRPILERLVGQPTDRKKRRQRYEHGELKILKSRSQLAVIAELVAICGVLTEPDFKDLLALVFHSYDLSRVYKQLALLVAMGMIRRSDDSDLIAAPDVEPLIDFKPEERVRLKARWRNAYSRSLPAMLEIAAGASV
jgi:hypothetical protein